MLVFNDTPLEWLLHLAEGCKKDTLTSKFMDMPDQHRSTLATPKPVACSDTLKALNLCFMPGTLKYSAVNLYTSYGFIICRQMINFFMLSKSDMSSKFTSIYSDIFAEHNLVSCVVISMKQDSKHRKISLLRSVLDLWTPFTVSWQLLFKALIAKEIHISKA